MSSDDLYERLGSDRPNLPAVGAAFIGITETVAGHERAFNRWYEDDHFYSGAMAGPWVMAGRRWVATHATRSTWAPEDSSILGPDGQGCYLKAYWFAEGHELDAVRWMRAAFDDLADTPGRFPTLGEDRIERVSAYSAFLRTAFYVSRRHDGVRPVHLLDHPFGGVCLDVLVAEPGADPADLAVIVKGGIAEGAPDVALGWRRDDTGWGPMSVVPGRDEVVVLWFFASPPGEYGYANRLAAVHAAAAESGFTLDLSASFEPTVPGTDAHVDQLGATTT